VRIARGRVLLLLFFSLTGCAAKDHGEWATLDRIRDFAEAQIKIEHLRKQPDVDWAEIKDCYSRTAALVGEIDATCGMHYATEIPEALGKCARGEEPRVNQQIVAKGLQHVAVLGIRGELDAVAGIDRKKAKAATERVAAYFEGIRPTFGRRDRDYFGSNPTLEAAAENALTSLREAAAAGGSRTIEPRRELEDVIHRTYALSVLYEVEEIERLRVTDPDECEVKRMEAILFYRILEPRISRHDAGAHGVLTKMLASQYDMMNAQVVEDNLRRGLAGIPLGRNLR
jgi:hypothetical protein